MLLILCVDLDDDLGRKTGIETPVMGREAVEKAALALAIADPSDSDGNVMFRGLQLYGENLLNPVEIAVITGSAKNDVVAGRKIGSETDEILNRMFSGEEIRTIIVTDGAQDESILPIIRTRVEIESVERVVVHQAQVLESTYYTVKQFIKDPDTRGTLLVPIGILVLIYPLSVIFENIDRGSSMLGIITAIIGVYVLFRGLGIRDSVKQKIDKIKRDLYTGKINLVSYSVAAIIILIGFLEGLNSFEVLEMIGGNSMGNRGIMKSIAIFAFGGIKWFGAAGIVSSVGHITDKYVNEKLKLNYLNAPVYVISISSVLYAVSGYIIGTLDLEFLAMVIFLSTVLGFLSTLLLNVLDKRLKNQ